MGLKRCPVTIILPYTCNIGQNGTPLSEMYTFSQAFATFADREMSRHTVECTSHVMLAHYQNTPSAMVSPIQHAGKLMYY